VASRGWRGPNPSLGYYRGGPPTYGGEGSMRGPKSAGTTAGSNAAPSNTSAWHPTVKYLLCLVAVEIIAFGTLRYLTKHGG
jgi:hypothetical protein